MRNNAWLLLSTCFFIILFGCSNDPQISGNGGVITIPNGIAYSNDGTVLVNARIYLVSTPKMSRIDSTSSDERGAFWLELPTNEDSLALEIFNESGSQRYWSEINAYAWNESSLLAVRVSPTHNFTIKLNQPNPLANPTLVLVNPYHKYEASWKDGQWSFGNVMANDPGYLICQKDSIGDLLAIGRIPPWKLSETPLTISNLDSSYILDNFDDNDGQANTLSIHYWWTNNFAQDKGNGSLLLDTAENGTSMHRDSLLEGNGYINRFWKLKANSDLPDSLEYFIASSINPWPGIGNNVAPTDMSALQSVSIQAKGQGRLGLRFKNDTQNSSSEFWFDLNSAADWQEYSFSLTGTDEMIFFNASSWDEIKWNIDYLHIMIKPGTDISIDNIRLNGFKVPLLK